jgi:hypothetical protein
VNGNRWVTVGGIRINRSKLSRHQRARLVLLRVVLAPLALMGLFATGQFSRVGGGFALDIVTGRASPGARTMYLALLTALPADSATIATLAETTMTGYARQVAAFTAPTAATPPSTQTSGVLTYGPVTGAMATISHAALVSSASGTAGDFVALWALGTARTPIANDSLQAAAGAFTMTDE